MTAGGRPCYFYKKDKSLNFSCDRNSLQDPLKLLPSESEIGIK